MASNIKYVLILILVIGLGVGIYFAITSSSNNNSSSKNTANAGGTKTESSYIPGTLTSNPTWTPFWSNQSSNIVDLGQSATDALFAKTMIIQRTCTDCDSDHLTVFYQRLTPIPQGWSAYTPKPNYFGLGV